MKARHVMLFVLVMATVFLTGFPNSTHRTLRADDPPSGITCGVWFPYVTDELDYDTGISIAGDSSYVTGPLHIYFYDLAGNWQGETVVNIGAGQNTQWMAMVSQLMPNFTGSMLITTYMSGVRATAIIMDNGGTGAMASTPAIIDDDITGVDQNHRVIRESQPTAPYKTTLVFPFITGESGFDTGFVINNTSGNEWGNATLYFYDKQGTYRGYYNLGGIHVNASCTVLLSQIQSSIVGQGFPPGQAAGCVIAVANFEHAQGCEFFMVPNGGVASGIPAVVDNDIYQVDGGTGELHRAGTAGDPEGPPSHTAIVIPYVTTSAVRQEATYVTLANTAGVLDGVGSPMNNTAHFYLYGLDGNIKTVNGNTCSWTAQLSSNSQMATIWLTPTEIALNGVPQAGYGGLGEFAGWMLITLNAPAGAYATAHVGNSTFNQFDSYVGAIDVHITGVDMTSGHEGEILREYPVTAGPPIGEWRVPFFATTGGFDTAVFTANAYNKADWPGGELNYGYYGHYANGDPVSYSSQAWPSGAQGVLPASAVLLSSAGFSGTGTVTVSTDGYPVGVAMCSVINNGDAIFIGEHGPPLNGVIDNVADWDGKPDLLAGGDIDAVTIFIKSRNEYWGQRGTPQFTTVVWVAVPSGRSSDNFITDADYFASTGAYYFSVKDSNNGQWTHNGRSVLRLSRLVLPVVGGAPVRRSWYRIGQTHDDGSYELPGDGSAHIPLAGWNASYEYHTNDALNDQSGEGPVLPTSARLQFMIDVLKAWRDSTDPNDPEKPEGLQAIIDAVQAAKDDVDAAGYW